jgi:hypothetical protein
MPVPVLVQNNEDGPTVFTDISTKESVDWEGRGDPLGGDVQIVPEVFVNNPNFIRAIQRGTFEIVNADEHPELTSTLEKQLKYGHITRQREASDARRESRRAQDVEALEHTENKDMLSFECVGPSAKGTGKCGVEVPVRAGRAKEAPPLCAKHGSLSNEFVPEDVIEGGETIRRWSRVRVGRRRSSRDND